MARKKNSYATRKRLIEKRIVKGIDDITRNFQSDEEHSMLTALGKIDNWQGGFDVGRTWQDGQHALVIALSPDGKRCIKVMGRVPDGVRLGEEGLKAIYREWLNKYRLGLTDDQMRAVVFAAALEA